MVLDINQLIKQAVAAHEEGKLEEAEHLYRELLVIEPNHPDANHNLGVLLFSLDKIDDSLQLFKTATEVNSNIEQFWVSYFNALIKGKKFRDVEIIFKKIADLKPEFIEAYKNLGYVLKTLGKAEEAEVIYKKVINLEPDYSMNHKNLGVVLIALKRFDEAEVCYKKAIRLEPGNAEFYSDLGYILFQKDKIDEAESNLTKAIEIDPNHGLALFIKGKILFDRSEFDFALKKFDNSDVADSRSRALICLYFLGRIEEIYQRIASQSELDEKNLRTAAFSAFISYKEKKVTAHKFCNNPIDFIKFSNLSSHLKDSNLLINEVIEELHNLKMVWEPYGKPVFKAFQSNFNLFENPSEKINDLKSIIMNEIDSYHLKFKNETCSFIKKWPSEKNINGWYVIYKQQGFQTEHDHPTGWLSGVIYLKVVPPLEKNEGAIEFGLNSKLYFDENSPKIIHQPKTGDIVLFPSSLQHRTIPFTTDTDRIIISFDLRPDLIKV